MVLSVTSCRLSPIPVSSLLDLGLMVYHFVYWVTIIIISGELLLLILIKGICYTISMSAVILLLFGLEAWAIGIAAIRFSRAFTEPSLPQESEQQRQKQFPAARPLAKMHGDLCMHICLF